MKAIHLDGDIVEGDMPLFLNRRAETTTTPGGEKPSQLGRGVGYRRCDGAQQIVKAFFFK